MMKQNFKIIAAAAALCISATPFAYAAPASNAWENDAVISAAAQAEAEETRRAEIQTQYSIYEPYGMTYDGETNRFYYEGQIVRCFKDEIDAENTNAFFYADGTVDIAPIKDANGKLTGLKPASAAEFEARTQRQDAIKAELGAADGSANSFEQGEADSGDDSLNAYADFGVSYDHMAQKWRYNGRIIHILHDAGHNTYCDASAEDGVNLEVIRGENGSIEKLAETDAPELEAYIE